MVKVGIITGVVVVFLYLSAAATLFFGQRKMLYHPPAETYPTNATSLTLKGEAGDLNGWVVNPDNEKALLYFGGNAESVEMNIPEFGVTFPDYAVYIFQYRGYGDSEGKPTEQGLYNDAVQIYKAAAAKHDTIFVIGRSLGSGVATYLATQKPVDKLVLITPYDSIVEVARAMFSWFPVDLLVRDKYESWKRVDQFTTPTLILSAGQDRVIPPARTKQLIAQFPADQLRVITYPPADHNNISNMPTFYADMRDFLSAE